MHQTEVIEYVMKRTHFKARQVIDRVPALGDVEDVQHDLIEDVLRRLPKFDGDRASVKTFVCRIIDNKIANLLKAHGAVSRGNGRTNESLDDWVHDEAGGWTRRGTTVEESRRHAHLGLDERDDHARNQLAMDTAGVIETLTPEQQTLCVKLQEQSPTQIAREADLPEAARRLFEISAMVEQGIDGERGIRPVGLERRGIGRKHVEDPVLQRRGGARILSGPAPVLVIPTAHPRPSALCKHNPHISAAVEIIAGPAAILGRIVRLCDCTPKTDGSFWRRATSTYPSSPGSRHPTICRPASCLARS
jgi:RNA polymerase sigma-70 factor (ECF subfamily)